MSCQLYKNTAPCHNELSLVFHKKKISVRVTGGTIWGAFPLKQRTPLDVTTVYTLWVAENCKLFPLQTLATALQWRSIFSAARRHAGPLGVCSTLRVFAIRGSRGLRRLATTHGQLLSHFFILVKLCIIWYQINVFYSILTRIQRLTFYQAFCVVIAGGVYNYLIFLFIVKPSFGCRPNRDVCFAVDPEFISKFTATIPGCLHQSSAFA